METTMKRIMYFITCIFVSVFLLAACNGDNNTITPTPPVDDPPVTNVINVADYGASPIEGKDNAEAIALAIAAAQAAEKPITLNFAKGDYHIYPDKAFERELYISNTVGADSQYKLKKIGLLFENANDITVEGNGSKLIFHGKMMTVAAIDSKNITLQNLTVDFAVPTVIDVTVESIGEQNSVPFAIFTVPECYGYEVKGNSINWLSDKSPYTGERYWQIDGVTEYSQLRTLDGKNIRVGRPPILNDVKKITDMGGGRIKIFYNYRDGAIKQGSCYQMRQTVRDHAGMFFWKSEDITVKSVNFNFLHGFGVVGQYSKNISIEGAKFATPKASGRQTAGYADFIQMSGCGGKITIKDSEFDNPHDDPINIHGTFMQISQRIAYNKFKFKFMHPETAGFPTFYVGDKVEFVNRDSLITDYKATVIAVQQLSLTESVITVDKSVPNNVGSGSHAIENVTYVPQVEITNCKFTSIPTRGILVTTRAPIIIQNNTFDYISMASIYVSSDANGWYESGAVKDLIIRNNTFSSCDTAILIEPTNSDINADKSVHSNITIESNIFKVADYTVLKAKSTAFLKVINNTFERQDNGDTHYNSPLFEFIGCFNAELEGNTYGTGLNLTAKLRDMPLNYFNNKDESIRINN